ncbi:pyridoxamine 5'-phosphate oxidase family protein [Aeromicrobium phragmitis]|nr:pyridoxamine 5'-phosphate oxidase family protein [Aeromicrobium phragmitis]
MSDEGHIRELTAEECREYLTLARIGRIAFNGPEKIELVVANVAVPDADHLLLRTEPDSVLAHLAGDEPTPVAVEIDHLEELYRWGWSLTVHGTARRASEEQVMHWQQQEPHPWAPGDRDLHVAITIEQMAGRKVRAAKPS